MRRPDHKTGSRSGLRMGAMLVGAAVLLAGCAAPELPREMPSFSSLTRPFQRPEARIPGERRAALPVVSANLEPSGKPVSLPAAVPSAEWANPGGPASNAPGHVSGGTGALAYTSSLGAGSRSRSRLAVSPIVHQGYVIGMDAEGKVSAVSLGQGGRGWTISTQPEGERGRGSTGAGIAASEGRVYVATAYNTVLALDVASGQQVWTGKLSAPARSAPTVSGGRIYVVSATNVVHALSTADGTEVWQYAGIPEQAGILSNASPAVAGGRVVVPYTSGEIIGFDAEDGKPVWSDVLTGRSRFSAVSGIRDVAARPVISDGRVYAIGVAGRLIAVEAKDGNRLWGTNISSASTPAVAGNAIFVVTLEGQLVAIDKSDGSALWTSPLPEGEKWVGPLLAGNALWIGGSEGTVLRADPSSGRVISQSRVSNGVLIPPVAASGRVLVLDDSARLHVFN